VSNAALEDESRELKGRQEQLAAVREKIATAVRDMDALGRTNRAELALREELANEEIALKQTFGTILEQGLTELRENRMQRVKELELRAEHEADLREVSVLYEDEEAVFRIIDDAYTFDFLQADACRVFELHPLDVQIVNEREVLWPGDASVRVELNEYDNHYGRVLLRMKQDAEEDEDMEDTDNLLQLLLGNEEQPDEDDEIDDLLQVNSTDSRPKEGLKKINRKQLWRELPVFLLFSFLFIFTLFSRRSGEGYFQVNAIRTLLVDENFGDYNEKAFADIRNFEEIFDWIQSVMIDGIYPDAKYNDEPFAPREVGAVMMYNRVVGGIRLRTVRAHPNVGCPDPSLNKRTLTNGTHTFEEKFVDECWMDLDAAINEETRPYSVGKDLVDEHGVCEAIPAPPPPPDRYLDNYGGEPPTAEALNAMSVRKLCRAFTYLNATETLEEPYASQKIPGVIYPGGGYVRDTDNPIDCRERPAYDPNPNPRGVCEKTGTAARDDILLAVDQLMSNTWLDQSTRAMFIKITFYNANLNLFMTIHFIFEFSLGGRVFPSTVLSVVSQELYQTSTPAQLTTTILQFVVSGFVLYYTWVQVYLIYRSFKKTGWIGEYISDIWNLLECVVLMAFYLSTYFQLLLLTRLYPPEVIFEDYYTDYAAIGEIYKLSFALDALCVIALFFKILKYAQLNSSTSMLWLVLTRAGKDMGYFIVFLIILMLAFAMMAMQFFGSQLYEYATFLESVISLLLVLLGQFDIEGMRMRQTGASIGLFFFLIYIVVMVLIMMNIFLAILGEAYSVTRAMMDEEKARQVKTKSRSLRQYIQLVRAIIRARVSQRRQRRSGTPVGKGKASFQIK